MEQRKLGRPPRDEVAEGERRAQILLAAADLFGRKGYAAVSLDQIAAEVGVTKAALYHHFRGKDALFTATMCQLLEEISESIGRIAASPAPLADRLRQLARGAVLYIPRDSDADALMRDVQHHLTADQQLAITRAHGRIVAAYEEMMRVAVERGELRAHDPRLLAHALRQLLDGFSGQRGADAAFQGRAEVAEAVVDLFLHGASTEKPD
jgi:AcrR family transcriptional regulator